MSLVEQANVWLFLRLPKGNRTRANITIRLLLQKSTGEKFLAEKSVDTRRSGWHTFPVSDSVQLLLAARGKYTGSACILPTVRRCSSYAGARDSGRRWAWAIPPAIPHGRGATDGRSVPKETSQKRPGVWRQGTGLLQTPVLRKLQRHRLERLDHRSLWVSRQLLRGRLSQPRGQHHRQLAVLPLHSHQPLPHARVQPLHQHQVLLRADSSAGHVHALLQRGAENRQKGHSEHDCRRMRLLVIPLWEEEG